MARIAIQQMIIFMLYCLKRTGIERIHGKFAAPEKQLFNEQEGNVYEQQEPGVLTGNHQRCGVFIRIIVNFTVELPRSLNTL